jgi:dimethylargininase
MQAMILAITREVSSSMEACELTHVSRQPIDIARAREQHAAYRACLRELGVCVIELPAEDQYPDAVFVEDPAVVVDEVAVIARSGAESRRGEADSIARELAKYRPLVWMDAPATLDGGDVMRAGRTLFVGRSARTNAAGIVQLAAAVEPHGYRALPVGVCGCLHLKSAASWLGEDTVLVHRPWVDAGAFAGMRLIDVPEGEEEGTNVLLVGDTVLVARGFPETAARVEVLGRNVRMVDNSELRKAEGALTCCSLIFTMEVACPGTL